MSAPNIKLASSLEKLQQLQKAGQTVIRSRDLGPTHLKRLVGARFLEAVINGWYIPANPADRPGDTTAWFVAMRAFIRAYCDDALGDDWYVSPEISLSLLTADTVLPTQVLVHAAKGRNYRVGLPAGTSLFDYRARDVAPAEQRTTSQGLRCLTIDAALLRATPTAWRQSPQTFRLALGQIPDVSVLLRWLHEGSHTVVAGRLAGAFRAVGRDELAVEIVESMRGVGHAIHVTNPFEQNMEPVTLRPEAPICGRIRAMWSAMRPVVLAEWPLSPRPRTAFEDWKVRSDARYVQDAYHSLSIEGYQVSDALIARVRSGAWNPETDERDRADRNALAARGYFESHTAVRESVSEIFAGQSPGAVARRGLAAWYRALWAPSLRAGLLKPADLAGWRNAPVFIRGSMHCPPPPEAVRDAMPLFFDLLSAEPEPAVQAVLGHFFVGFLHPYPDGNGRLARFMMNAMLAAGGWEWTIITVQTRDEYMAALEAGSVRGDIAPFTRFIAEAVSRAQISGMEDA